MKRRDLLRTVGPAALGLGSGCLGGGGDVVVSVTESVSIDAGSAWVKEIPDVSDPGGALKYVVRSSDGPFDVYFFADRTDFEHYDAYIKGGEPAATPSGHRRFSSAAVPASGDGEGYEAATEDGGAREPLDAMGPYYFVVDHSSYRMENRVDEYADPLSAFVDLTVVRKKFGF